MIKSIYFPDREFATKSELFDAIKKDEKRIKALKGAEIILSHERGHISKTALTLKGQEAKALNIEDGYFYPVINTTNYLDSHQDVHIPKIWNKSISEQQGSIFYVADHSLKINDVIAWNTDVEVMTKTLNWDVVGKDYQGQTEALIFKVKKESICNDAAEDIIEKNKPVQNSVRMQYVVFHTCINDKRPEYKTEKANWDKYYPLVANKEVADNDGYFWAVTEAKIVKEGSMVLFGSNDATPILQTASEEETKCTNCNSDMSGQYCSNCGTQRKNIEPSKDTQAKAAALALRNRKIKSIINQSQF